MKNIRAFNVLYGICFAAALLVPLVFFDLTGTVSNENRMLAKFPAWPKSAPEVSIFTSGVETWLNDRIGFRNKMLLFYRYIELYGFKVSPSEIVALGSDGTAFLTRAAHSKVKNQEILESLGENDSHYPLYAQQMEALYKDRDALKQSPNRIVVLAVPTAPLFRFENLPRYIKMIVSPKTPSDHPVAQALTDFTAINTEDSRYFLFPFAEGAELAKQYAPYPQKNFHWSCSPFSAMISELVTERLGQPVTRQWTAEDFTPCTTDSDLAHLVGVPLKNENDLCPSAFFYDKMEITSSPISDAFPGPAATRTTSGTYYKNTAVATGKVLVVGDSFNFSLGLPLARNFREVIVLDGYGVARETNGHPEAVFLHIKDAYRPDAIVFLRHNIFPTLTEYMPGLELFLR